MTRKRQYQSYGFVGLGNMGAPMAANLSGWLDARRNQPLVVFDAAGTVDRTPDAASPAATASEVARRADVVFLSLPDGAAVTSVTAAIAQAEERRVSVVVDLSTIGINAAQDVHRRLADHGIAFVDCPVSGGQIGARNAAITLMWAGSADILATHRPALAAFAKNIFHVGNCPGKGQALKLLNNFLSATITGVTGEALLFGLTQGLDLKTMLDVINVSTGGSNASKEKFVRRVLPETFDSGFDTALMAKDVSLFMESLHRTSSPDVYAGVTNALWQDFLASAPESDHMEIYNYIKGLGRKENG